MVSSYCSTVFNELMNNGLQEGGGVHYPKYHFKLTQICLLYFKSTAPPLTLTGQLKSAVLAPPPFS